jgi:NAD(P)-dependent dehydrogenase (short-subunit alcohol dehydrogenase family)
MDTFYSDEFKGKVAVITGGTAGIGRHLAITLARHGAEVFFCGRHLEQGEEAMAQCERRGHYCKCDMAVSEDIAEFVKTALGFNGQIDYLVNNVAIDTRIKFEEVTLGQFDHFIAVNLRSAFAVTQAALPGLRSGSGRSVVNLGTTNYMLGLAPFTAYNLSKSGLLGFTRSLARELGPERIRVNMLSPGWIMTEKQLRLYVNEQDKKELLRDQALPFLLTEEGITPVLLFLLSSASGVITGQNLVADGGKFMQ